MSDKSRFYVATENIPDTTDMKKHDLSEHNMLFGMSENSHTFYINMLSEYKRQTATNIKMFS